MATIKIKIEPKGAFSKRTFKGIGEVEKITIKLRIPRTSLNRFENVVKRVLTKNLTEQGIEPISIEYSE